jgi:asparagine synthase (glutamine-hydrolysing)
MDADWRRATRLIGEVRAARLTYCGPPKLETLAAAALRVRGDGVAGLYLEAGVALGGSAIVLARLKPPGVPLLLFDVFAMIPPPGEKDGEDAHARYAEINAGRSRGLGGDVYYGYVDNLLNVVKANLGRFGIDPDAQGISFFEGLFEETLHPEGPVALAHIDCDWYDSVRVCIDRIVPRLAPGGMLVFDDYSSYSGCRKAVDELMRRDRRFEIVASERSIALRLAPDRSGAD